MKTKEINSLNDISVGDKIYDEEFNCYGFISEIIDDHNIYVHYEENEYGGGLYCINKNCSYYNKLLKIIENESNS